MRNHALPPATVPLVIAHRGASGYRPEHTRSAYELAFALGCDAVEPDLVLSKDGVLVIRHENEISGTTDVASRREFQDRHTTKLVDGETQSGWFTEDFTWAELATLRATERLPELRRNNTTFVGEGILRFEDLLELLDGADRPIGLVAEIKHATHFAGLGLNIDELFVSALAAAGWTDDARLIVESFELTVLHRIRDLGVRCPIVYLVEGAGYPADRPASPYAPELTDAGLAALAAVADGISVPVEIVLARGADRGARVTDFVGRAHQAGLTVYCWTLRAENRFLHPEHRGRGAKRDFGNWAREFELILSSGIDGVFVDQPDLALAVRATL